MSSIKIERSGYCPDVIINEVSSSNVGVSTTTLISVTGRFLDQVNYMSVSSNFNNNTSSVSNLIVVTPEEISFELNTGSIPDDYFVTLFGTCGQVVLSKISAIAIEVIIPTNNGVAPNLWVKSTSSLNNSITTTGGFECENNSGNGWYEHAWFGPITSNTQLDFTFKVDRLYSTYGAYCFIRFNTYNGPSTSGNPRIYISNGSGFTVYNSNGISTSLPSLHVNDIVKIEITTNSMKVFVNDLLKYTNIGVYSLNNITPTFTGYRVFKVSDIIVKSH